jgi:hypothetical protein
MLDYGIEVEIPENIDFLQIHETLTRIGIASKTGNILTQSVHILNKRGKYYIISFKTMFYLDGKDNTLDNYDKARVNTIANLLEKWKLVKIVDKININTKVSLDTIKIVPFREKYKWKLVTKYKFGFRKYKD